MTPKQRRLAALANAKRTDAELIQASFHVLYEWRMMRETVPLLARPPRDQTEYNALLESFLVHLRNLLVFIGWHESCFPNDVIAEHFVPTWKVAQAAIDWEQIYADTCAHVMHMSFARLSKQKQWDFAALSDEVSREMIRFHSEARPGTLHLDWQRGAKPSGPVGPSGPTLAGTTGATGPNWP